MRAVFICEHGDIECVQVGDQEDPQPGAGEVLIELRASALNHLDIWVRRGIPGVRPPLPHVLGSDGSGIVTALGPGATGVHVGQEVLLNPGLWCGQCEFCRAGDHSLCISYHLLGEHRWGTLAEKVVAPAASVHPKPARLSFVEAAAFPLVFLTAYRMLFTRAGLRVGETVLIHGVGGGVASAALLLAVRAGARVAVTSSSQEKLDRARELGAELGVNYRDEDVERAIMAWTKKRGADVVIDSLAGPVWAQSLASVCRGGRIVTCGATLGYRPETDIARLFWKQASILGSTMGSRDEMARVVDLFDAPDGLKPPIDKVFPLSDAKAAMAHLEEGRQFGKVVLTI